MLLLIKSSVEGVHNSSGALSSSSSGPTVILAEDTDQQLALHNEANVSTINDAGPEITPTIAEEVVTEGPNNREEPRWRPSFTRIKQKIARLFQIHLPHVESCEVLRQWPMGTCKESQT